MGGSAGGYVGGLPLYCLSKPKWDTSWILSKPLYCLSCNLSAGLESIVGTPRRGNGNAQGRRVASSRKSSVWTVWCCFRVELWIGLNTKWAFCVANGMCCSIMKPMKIRPLDVLGPIEDQPLEIGPFDGSFHFE
jgi:hypothetical protein